MATVEELRDRALGYVVRGLSKHRNDMETWGAEAESIIDSLIAAAREEGAERERERAYDYGLYLDNTSSVPSLAPKGPTMANLESIVLPLSDSRALVEHGIVLETALYWFRFTRAEDRSINDGYSVARTDGEYYAPVKRVCGAPVLSELLGAIRDKVGNPLEERTIILSHDGHLEVPCCAGVRSSRGEYMIAYGDTDLKAAAALLMEVSR